MQVQKGSDRFKKVWRGSTCLQVRTEPMDHPEHQKRFAFQKRFGSGSGFCRPCIILSSLIFPKASNSTVKKKKKQVPEASKFSKCSYYHRSCFRMRKQQIRKPQSVQASRTKICVDHESERQLGDRGDGVGVGAGLRGWDVYPIRWSHSGIIVFGFKCAITHFVRKIDSNSDAHSQWQWLVMFGRMRTISFYFVAWNGNTYFIFPCHSLDS